MPTKVNDSPGWSLETVPLPIRLLSDRLKKLLDRAQTDDRASTYLRNPDVSAAESYIIESIQHQQRVIDLATDSRALLTCYAHHFRKGTPTATATASAQNITAPGLRRRYNLETLAALELLIRGSVEPSALVSVFPSLQFEDLFGIHPELDTKLEIKGIPRRPSTTTPSGINLAELDDRTYKAAKAPVADWELEQVQQLRSYKGTASELLGIVMDRLRSDLFSEDPAAWMDGSTNPRQVRVKWLRGPSVSQVVQLLLPVGQGEKGVIDMDYGIPGLRLETLSYEGAVLTWHARPNPDDGETVDSTETCQLVCVRDCSTSLESRGVDEPRSADPGLTSESS